MASTKGHRVNTALDTETEVAPRQRREQPVNQRRQMLVLDNIQETERW